MTKRSRPAKEDIGAAMMAWYADALARHPGGLVTQAQAAAMLGVSRMAVTRLVARGYLRALYFPRPNEIAGVSVGRYDPCWLRVAAWLGVDPAESEVGDFPKACYVSFADVVEFWRVGQARAKCTRDWQAVLAELAAVSAARGEGPSAARPSGPSEHAPPGEELETWML